MRFHSPRCLAAGLALAVLALLPTAVFADDKYEELCAQGRKQLAERNYIEAEKTFGRALDLSPKEAYPHFGRALARRNLKNYQGTIQDCTDALELGVKKTVYYTLRADAHLALHDTEAAVKDYTAAITPEHHDPYPRLARAKILHTQKEFAKAIIDYEHALEDMTTAEKSEAASAEAWQGLARAYYEIGNPGKALENFQRAADLEPQVAQHHYWRGVIFHDRGLFDDAFKEADLALAIDNGCAAAYGLRGVCIPFPQR